MSFLLRLLRYNTGYIFESPAWKVDRTATPAAQYNQPHPAAPLSRPPSNRQLISDPLPSLQYAPRTYIICRTLQQLVRVPEPRHAYLLTSLPPTRNNVPCTIRIPQSRRMAPSTGNGTSEILILQNTTLHSTLVTIHAPHSEHTLNHNKLMLAAATDGAKHTTGRYYCYI